MATHPDAPEDASRPTGIVLTDRQLKALRWAVIIMGVILVLGFGAVIARIVYLVSRGGESVPALSRSETLSERMRLVLPAGAVVRHLALSGNRLAVHYDSPAGNGILILDLLSGRTLSRIELAPAPPQ